MKFELHDFLKSLSHPTTSSGFALVSKNTKCCPLQNFVTNHISRDALTQRIFHFDHRHAGIVMMFSLVVTSHLSSVCLSTLF